MKLRAAFRACSFVAASLVRPATADEPVTVTVVGDVRPPGEVAAEPFVSTSRVERERLASPGLRAGDVLRSEAGVQITESGGLGAPATASIRGATAAQTPIYLGGVRLNDLVGGVADLATLPLWLIERVDVYRGNAPLSADELGIGGAILFEPRRPGRDEAGAGATLGSFGTQAAFGYLAAANGEGAVLLGVSAERADNDYPFTDDRGTLFRPDDDVAARRRNADASLLDGWLLARLYAARNARLELLVNYAAREQGAPKLAQVPSESARSRLERALMALSARLYLDDARRQLLTLRTSVLSASSELSDPARELGTLSEQTLIGGRRVEQQALWELAAFDGLQAAVSASGSVERLARRDGDSESSASASTLRGAGRLQWGRERGLALFGLLGAECRATKPRGGGCGEPTPVGRVGLGFRAASSTTYLTLSRYQRTPALGELYGAGVLVRGNSELEPELGLGVDLGTRLTQRVGDVAAHLETSLFARTARELVAYARTAQGYVVPLNVNAARVLGLELTAGALMFEHLGLHLSATLLDARDTTPDSRLRNDFLPFVSRLALAPRLVLTTGERAGRVLSRADLGVDFLYLSNRFADSAGLVLIPEQTTWGAQVAAGWWGGLLVTRARLANALNAPRFDVVGYPLPKRSMYLSAEVRTP